MRRLLFFMVFVVLLAVESPSASAQTDNAVAPGNQPCIAGTAPGKPTLKRRRPTAESGEPDGAGPVQNVAENVRCAPEALATPDVRKLVGIEFEGPHSFKEGDVLGALREGRFVPSQTRLPDPEVLAKGVASIKALLETRGYFHATVGARTNVSDEMVSLVFSIAEGKRLPLAEIRFEGNKNFSSEELAAETREYLAQYQEVESEYDSGSFESALRRALNFVRSRGYLQATFGEPAKEIDERGLVLRVAVNEGRRYRLGAITIEGAESIAPAKVRAMLGLRPGDIASAEAIGEWLFEHLRKAYGEQGFVEYIAEPEPEFRAAANSAGEGVVDFKITIEEGRRFRVNTIKFQGSSLADEELLRVLKLRAGDVYNRRLFEESIDELNKLGLFEFIDKDKDTDFRTNAELSTVSIVIKLNPPAVGLSRDHRR